MQEQEEQEKRRQKLEDEVRDNSGAISYVFPRPLRKVVWGVFAANAFWGALVLYSRYASEVCSLLSPTARHPAY